MSEDNNKTVQVARREMCRVISCMYHKNESRYQVKYFERLNLVIVECLECKPPTEIVRFALPKG